LYDLDKDAYLSAGNTGKEDGSDFINILKRGPATPTLNDSYTDSKSTVFNISATYEKIFNSVHNFNAFIAFETNDYKSKGISRFRKDFISDRIPYLFAGGDDGKTNNSWVSIDTQANYFGRLMYNYDGTYLFQFTFRRDGSLRFSKEYGRWGNFPGVILGWIISNEDFWKEHLSSIDFFKLRASWAELGNDRVPAFQYLTSYQFGTGIALGSSRSYYSSLYQSNIPNPRITWEVANMYNAGFESIFLNNHFQFNTDLFYQRREDILVKRNASVPSYIGLSLPDENFGIVDNKGIEIVLGYNNKSGDLSYSFKGTYTYAINSVVEFDEPLKINEWQTLTGHPIGTQLLYNKIGVFNDSTELMSYPHLPGTKPGDIILEDYNKDGKITSDDMILVDKTANPRSTYSVNFNLTFKNWYLSALFYGVGDCMRQKNQGNYKMLSPDDRWTKDNPTSEIPRTSSGHSFGVSGGGASTYSYLDASYFRLKNLNISYRLSSDLVSKIYLKEASIYASGENLFLLSKLKTPVDPELGQQGNQFSNYPINRVISLGIRVAF